MSVRKFGVAILLWVAPVLAHAEEPVTVMIVGGYHMSNPGRDLHNVQADDVLAPKRQAEIADVTDALARFHPTQVDVEWSADMVAQRYDLYAKGTLPPSHNEVVQLGFRLAHQTDAAVHGVDVDGDFPYEAVEAYAKAHGESDILTAANANVQGLVEMQDALMKTGTVSQILRALNDAPYPKDGNYFYRLMLKVGGGDTQPGADLLTAWYKRNFYICANIVQLAKPGDRIVVFY